MFDSFKDKALAAAKGQTFQAIKDGVKKATGVDINLNGQQNQQSTGYAPSGQNYYQQPNHGYAPPPPAAAPAPYPAQSAGKPSVPMRDASGASICYICHSSSFGRIMCGGCACVNCEKEPKMTNSNYCSTHGCSKCFQAKYANQDYCPSCLDKMKKAAAPPPPPPMAQQQQHYQQQSHHYQQQPQQYQQQPQQYQQQPHHYQQQPQQHYQQQPQQYQQQQTREMHQSYAPEPVQAPADPVELTALQLAELSLKQPGPLRDATGRSLCVRCRNPSFGKKACQECECASCMEQAAIEGTDYCPNCTCPTFGCTQTKSRHDKVCSSCKTKMLYWGRDRWDLVEGPKDPAPSGLAVIVVDSFHADDLAKVKSQLPSNTVYLEPKCSPLQHVRFMVEGGWESYQRHDSHFLLVYDNELIFINEKGDEQPCKLDTVGEAYELIKKYGESSLDDLEFEINKLAAPKMEGGINGVAFIYTSMFDEQPMKDIVANLKRPATAIDKVPTFGSVYNEDLREWLQFNNYQFPYFVRYDRSVEVVLMEPTAYRQIPCRNHQIEQLLDYIDQNPGRSDDYYNEYGNELIVAAAAVEDAEEAERKKVFTIGDGRGIPVFIIEKFWDSADVIEQALAGHDPKIIKLGGSYNTLGVLMSIEEFVPGHQGLIISVAHDDGVIQLSNPTQVVGRQQWLDVGMQFLPAVMEKMPASYVEYVLAQNDPRIARGRFVTYF